MDTRKPYPTDLQDTAWQVLAPWIPAAKPGGRPEHSPTREIVNALLSVVRTGCAWRFVPNDVPPWSLGYHSLWPWRRDGTWQRLHDTWRGDRRVLEGRTRQPSAVIMDAQTVKTTDRGGETGCDGAKQLTGRKRHILVETLGLLIAVVVTAARVQARDGATCLLGFLRPWCPRLRCIGADGASAWAPQLDTPVQRAVIPLANAACRIEPVSS